MRWVRYCDAKNVTERVRADLAQCPQRVVTVKMASQSVGRGEGWQIPEMSQSNKSLPSIKFLTHPHRLEGNVWKHDVRTYEGDEQRKACMDKGAMCCCVKASKIPDYIWALAWDVKDTFMVGVGKLEVKQLVPIKIAMGAQVTQALWTFAMPMDDKIFPFEDCDVIIDQMTIHVLTARSDWTDPSAVVTRIRSEASMREVIEYFNSADMSKSMSQVCNRLYVLDRMEPLV